MPNVLFKTAAAIVGLTLTTAPAVPHSLDAVMEGLDPATLGKVNFVTSCNSDAEEAFEVGLLLLHHMMYRQSARAFGASRTGLRCAQAK